MRYEGRIYRPPSEAYSLILQATIGCSWNKCSYCDMYREKEFRHRPVAKALEDLELARSAHGPEIQKIFVADGDALILEMASWRAILTRARELFPQLRRVSCYAMARNVLEKTEAELSELRQLGLSLLYIGPESGDDPTLKRIAKGSTFEEHVQAAHRARAADMALSVIFLLGAGGVEHSSQHAKGSARLATAMDPRFLSALTLTVIPNTPIAKLQATGRFELPEPVGLLEELRTLVEGTEATNTIFRTNHASNYLSLEGRLPRDRQRIISTIDQALSGEIPLRPEFYRGL